MARPPRTPRNMLAAGKLSSEQLFQRTSWNTLGAEMPIARRALGAKAATILTLSLRGGR